MRLSEDEYEALRTYAFATDSSNNELDALLKKARTKYGVALDKLADLSVQPVLLGRSGTGENKTSGR